MKKKFLRACILLTALIIAGVGYSFSSKPSTPLELSVGAVYEPYAMTKEYRSGRFYSNLVSLDLSGDEARDVLAIAMSQVGYHEGNSDADMNGESTDGTRDFVEYNVLAGKYDNFQGNGESYGYYWCASFVNWCLRMAKVSESASGSEVSCQRWYDDCKDMGIFNSKSGYLPRSGDMIFFRDEGSLAPSTHVGLVRYSDGAHVYTVEGNTSSGNEYSSRGEYVALKSYPLSSKYIVGYASPKYSDNKTAHTVDYSGSFLSIGQYISESESNIFEDPELTVPTEEKISRFSLFYVRSVSEGALGITYKGKNGYISSDSAPVQLTTNENVYVTNFLDENRYMLFAPQYRRQGEQRATYANPPQRDGSGFVKWVSLSDSFLSVNAGDKLPEGVGDITLIAVWDTELYTVEFKNTDGTQIEAFNGYYGTEYSVPEPKAPEGQVFAGWNEEPEGVIRGNAVFTSSFVPEGELSSVAGEADTSSEVGGANDIGCTSSLSGAALVLSALVLCPLIVNNRKKQK